MGRRGTVTVTSRMSAVTREETDRMDRALAGWASDTLDVSARIAPHLTGALINSGKIKREKELEWSVSYGNRQVPYARRRHFENNKNPGTRRYLERAGDTNARNFGRYL